MVYVLVPLSAFVRAGPSVQVLVMLSASVRLFVNVCATPTVSLL